MPDSHSSDARRPARGRRVAVSLVKGGLAAAILAYLFFQLRDDDGFQRLLEQPKNWGMLAAAQALVLTALAVNYIRWYVLGRALDLDFSIRDAFRLGALGMLLNQVSPGALGGDLFKAVFIAREQPGKRTEAVASVLIDRVVGLYAMLLVASLGYAIVSQTTEFTGAIRAVSDAVVVCAAIGTAGIALLMTPWFTGPAVRNQLARLPVVGGTLARLVDAAAAYRQRRVILLAGILIGCTTHVLFVLAFWCIGQGLPIQSPPLAMLFVITPMSLAAGAIPLTPSGLGVAEAACGQLFRSAGYAQSDGVMVGLAYRVMTYVMAAIGGAYYVRARRQVREALDQAEELAESEA
ncbi:MAG TPA: lysylphosphatidylglycerol synthase transmembrane domain-containing protein [Lacipirellulaceae bacterium]|nr:lysylphosphatidylglycerol synthase transmembrane domain-containing protein [Lacipirellulaceae bacterium]